MTEDAYVDDFHILLPGSFCRESSSMGLAAFGFREGETGLRFGGKDYHVRGILVRVEEPDRVFVDRVIAREPSFLRGFARLEPQYECSP